MVGVDEAFKSKMKMLEELFKSKLVDLITAASRVSKGISPPAPHRTVREPLDSYGSSRCVFQLISGAYTPMGKQAGLHFVQRIQPFAAFAQAHSFVPLAPFFKSSVHKAPKVVQVSFYKMAVVVLPATYQWIYQICNHINTPVRV